MKSIYKIFTNLTPEKSAELINSMNQEEINFIDSFCEEVVSVDIVENGLIISYVISSSSNLEKIIPFFHTKFIKFVIKDVTKFFLIGKEKIKGEDFDQFLINNIKIDDVLDKISESGFESLTNFDKKVLEQKRYA